MLTKILNIVLLILILGLIGSYLYKLPKFKKGQKVPNFTVTAIDNREISLYDYQGKFILLDFWGSWCGPCRRENKELVKLYESYKEQSDKFEILSIGIEKSEEAWRAAIRNDSLVWPGHIIQKDLFKSPLARSYGVREIPTKYILDKSGNVVMTNPSFKEIRDYLSKELPN